ncbi:metallophosphoesterase family protein [Sorangium cellulosum]|uniref:metallophosphoesterase family protein n=1 Tax=Sorangium cellulosum TaxID=56 RepID=UPI0009D675AC|nr:metallophosphoesterase [Sorangium cellulosum]
MGYRFELRHSNIVVYLTTPATEPPRVERDLLHGFLGAMRKRLDRPWRSGGRILTRDPSWHERLRIEAEVALDALDRVDDEPVLAAEVVSRVLRPLRMLLSQFRLFVLPVWSGPHAADHLLIRSESLALDTEEALVLFPEVGLKRRQAAGLDALPAFDVALQHQREWPGALLWTDRGGAAFVPDRGIDRAFEACARALRGQDGVALENVISDLSNASGDRLRRILHLSDLHFGSKHAAINAPLLQAELHDAVRSVDRVVVTGDLFDNPSPPDLARYQNFAQQLHRTSGHEPICIPGNHDMRWLGNIGSTAAQVAALRWSSHVVDDKISTIFLGFNSAEGGSWARGEVGQNQMTRIAAEHRNAVAIRPELRNYLSVALVHHHPYSFETTPATFVQRMLAAFNISDEPAMRLVDADQFTDWCARWGVSVMLHGHKHVPRYEIRTIHPEGGTAHALPAVGCGSSLGAEGAPMSYGVLTWSETRRRWSTSFFESRGGGPFVTKLITVTRDADALPEVAA